MRVFSKKQIHWHFFGVPYATQEVFIIALVRHNIIMKWRDGYVYVENNLTRKNVDAVVEELRNRFREYASNNKQQIQSSQQSQNI